ncbi:hypothetical protein J3D46_000699 [Paenarthrobacter sp. A20]|nr:hypothetical protein [Paenarthrobacter sp. A20]
MSWLASMYAAFVPPYGTWHWSHVPSGPIVNVISESVH